MFAALVGWGRVLAAAGSDQQAIEATTKQEFDVVVSDIGMRGWTDLNCCRGCVKLRMKPVVAVTGLARAVYRQKALDAGFDEHLGKPLRRLLPGGPHGAGKGG
jgi:CheY-like chemotaxis protein